ncbi:MAG: LysM peptidoglycan-binding domain-containing protein [Putridiphycobacter sp.]
MNKISLLIVILFSTILSFAQPGKAEVETVNGKKYYAHFVEKGQTLYAIHQMYDVPVDQIVAANNNLTDGLQIGQKVLVPISTDNTNYYGEHTVEKGETLYGISKQYKCSVDDLKNLNPELKEASISIGQKIIVPRENSLEPVSDEKIITEPNINPVTPSISEQDSIIEHTVLAHETLYSISKRYMVTTQSIKTLNNLKSSTVKEGDVLKIRVKQVNYEIIENPLNVDDSLTFDSLAYQVVKKDKYKVALLLPLMLSQNSSYMNKPIQPGQVPTLHPLTKVASDFYRGFVLAADSLTKAGLNLELYVVDTKKDVEVVKTELNKPEMADLDIIFGPLFSNTIDYVADYCKSNHIKMVIPFKAQNEVLYENPNVFNGTASNMTLMNGLVDYVVENHSNHYVTIFKPTSETDLALFETARERYNSKIASNTNAMTPKIVELKSLNWHDINSKLRKDTTNVVIVPSVNLKYVASVFTSLNNVLNGNPYAKKMKIIVFGLEDWNKFKDLDLKHRMRLNQHYASYRFIDYNQEKTKKMILSYRHKFDTDPDVFGVQGFDLGYYFLSAMYLNGVNFQYQLQDYNLETVQNDFYFPSDSLNGRENRNIFIVNYDNYELKLKSTFKLESH